MIWVRDEHVLICYFEDLKNDAQLNDEAKNHNLNTIPVLGAKW